MSEISTLQPKLLWQWFDQICAIPHPSYHEQALAAHIMNWAKNKGFFAEQDEVGNVLIRKPATAGMENHLPVVLQAHLDMVPQANEHQPHNFETDPISPYIDGDWVKAKGTTLGADNGIGMASALAVLESQDLAHPPLEVLLTMTEEQGMDGALGLRPNWLQGQLLINTDTEENGQIYIGCAGGENANLQLPLQFENNAFAHQYQINLKGLCGGHSGCDIHTGRANAIKVLARVLAKISQNRPLFAFQLSDIRGGSVRNAIPREATATLAFNGEPAELQQAVQALQTSLQQELALSEPNLSLTCQPVNKTAEVFSEQTTQTIIRLLNLLPNGVIRNSDVIKNVVETSLSVGVLNVENQRLNAVILMRSLIESGKDYVASQLQSLAELTGAELKLAGNYPGWEPVEHSTILDLTHKVYAEVLGKEPDIQVIHAGLECGLLKKSYPHIEMVSIGPTIRNAHSPDEKVQISAVQIYWKVLTNILAAIPAK